MDNQEAFDIMVVHAFAQKERAIGDDKCVYRAEDGKKCFIGALIPDEQYRSWMEGKTATALMLTVPALQGLDAMMLSRAQDTHDSDNRNHWFKSFEMIAKDYSLNTNVLDKYEGIEL